MRNSDCKRLKSQIVSLSVFLFLIMLLSVTATFTSCIESIRESNLFSSSNDKSNAEADSVFDILLNYYNNDTDSAIIVAAVMEDEFVKEDNTRDLVRLYSFLSEVYQYRKNDDYRALEYITKAMDMVATHPDYEFDRTFLYVNVGNIMFRYKLFYEAIYIYREIPKITDAATKPEVMALINSNIALSYQAMDMCDSARSYFDLSLRFVEKAGKDRTMLRIQYYNYLSSLALQCGDFDSIPVYYGKADELFDVIDTIILKHQIAYINQYWQDVSLGYYTNKIRSFDKMAEYYKINGNYEAAEELYINAMHYARLSDDCIWCTGILLGLSETFLLSKDYDIAMDYVDSCENFVNNENIDFEIMSRMYNQKAEIFLNSGKKLDAKKYAQLAIQYNDSLIIQKTSDDVILKKIELAVKPVQLAMKNIELSRNEKIRTIENQNLLIKLLLVAFIFIALISFVYYRLYRNLKKTQIELATRTIEKIKIVANANVEKTKLKDVIDQELLQKFEEEMLEKKAYLESNISLIIIAEKLETNRSYISRIINTVYGMNFNDYINKLRINEACKIICNNTNPNFTIDHLFSEVGFTGKSTFYVAFKKYTGVTPAVFFNLNNQPEQL